MYNICTSLIYNIQMNLTYDYLKKKKKKKIINIWLRGFVVPINGLKNLKANEWWKHDYISNLFIEKG